MTGEESTHDKLNMGLDSLINSQRRRESFGTVRPTRQFEYAADRPHARGGGKDPPARGVSAAEQAEASAQRMERRRSLQEQKNAEAAAAQPRPGLAGRRSGGGTGLAALAALQRAQSQIIRQYKSPTDARRTPTERPSEKPARATSDSERSDSGPKPSNRVVMQTDEVAGTPGAPRVEPAAKPSADPLELSVKRKLSVDFGDSPGDESKAKRRVVEVTAKPSKSSAKGEGDSDEPKPKRTVTRSPVVEIDKNEEKRIFMVSRGVDDSEPGTHAAPARMHR